MFVVIVKMFSFLVANVRIFCEIVKVNGNNISTSNLPGYFTECFFPSMM